MAGAITSCSSPSTLLTLGITGLADQANGVHIRATLNGETKDYTVARQDLYAAPGSEFQVFIRFDGDKVGSLDLDIDSDWDKCVMQRTSTIVELGERPDPNKSVQLAPANPGACRLTLVVAKTGNGNGSVAYKAGGLDCPTQKCEGTVTNVDTILLETKIIAGTVTWSEASCGQAATCTIPISALDLIGKQVTATFDATPANSDPCAAVNFNPIAISTSTPQPTLNSVWASSDSDVHIVGASTAVHLDRTAGTQQAQTVPIGETLSAIWGLNRTASWSPATTGRAYFDDGSTLMVNQVGFADDKYDGVWGSGASDFYIVGSGFSAGTANNQAGLILHYGGQAGNQWSRDLASSQQPLHAIWGSAPNRIFAVGDNGTVLLYSAMVWATLPLTAWRSTKLNAVFGNTQSVWLAGDGGILLRSDNSGTTWSPVTIPNASTTNLYGVWADDKRFIVVGQYQTFKSLPTLFCQDVKGTFPAKTYTLPAVTGDLRGVYGSTDKVWVVGAGGVFLESGL